MVDNKDQCPICLTIARIKSGNNPFFVTELETGYVVLGDYQFYKGYTLFLCKKHVFELHKLPHKFAVKYLLEMMWVAKVVWQAFKPEKLNYELLGNSHPHLHWHIFPRYKNDPRKSSPVWRYSKKVRTAKKYQPNLNELLKLKEKLLSQIEKLSKNK